MKITHIVAAALMVAGIGMSGAASAQMNNGSYQQRTDHRGGGIRDDRGQHDDRRNMRDRRDDRRSYGRDDRRGWNTGRRAYGRDDRRGWGHGRQHCRTEWRHQRRVRICR